MLSALTNVGLAIPAIVVIILVSVSLQSATSDDPGAGHRLHRLVLAGARCARPVQQRPNPGAHRRREAVRRRLRSHPGPRRPALPAVSYVVMAFVLQISGAILFESTLSLLGPGPVQRDEPGHHALLGDRLGLDPDRRLVGVRPADHHADPHRRSVCCCCSPA